MRTTSPAIWIAIGLSGLAAAGCEPRGRRADPPPAVTVKAQPVAPAPGALTPGVAAPLTSDPLARPVGSEAVDQALAAAQQFNTNAAAELAGIAKSEARIRALAARIASPGSSAIAETQRRNLSTNAQAARVEVEALHDALAAGAAAFRLASAAGAQQLAAAVAQCAADVELAAYAGCTALSAQQAPMAQTTASLGRRYEAAEAVYRQERARLEEASAIIALGVDGTGFR